MPGRAGKKTAVRRAPSASRRAAPAAKRASATKRPAKPAAGAKKPARQPAKPAVKKTAAKRPAVKKTVAKKTATTARVKKPAAKAVAKKASKRPTPPAKKAAKPVAKKATEKPAAKKGAEKATAKKTAAPAKAAATKAAPAPARPSILEGRTKHGKNTVICPLSGFEVTPGPANLGAKTLDRLRQKLVDEKARLLHQAADLSAEAEQLAREREAGDTQFDEESGEGDTVNVERERDLLLSATARQVVEEIDDALDRMKRNKYGVCKPAGRKIALERLEAIPWAQVCVDCKARAERRR
jgi:RNA polymerase-binding transcription factor DksA